MTHDLKTWTNIFADVWRGAKNFDVRKNDRDFKVGDILNLKEYMPQLSEKENRDVYTGRSILCHVDYILHGGQFGIEEGYCVMSISEISKIKG